MNRSLIVNADDFGLTKGVSRGILRGHREGIITSTSALAVGPAFAETAKWLEDAPSLGVGLHLAAVGEDPPLLTAREIPTLVDDQGRLDLSWRTFLPRAALRRIDPDDLRREFTAQYECIVAAVGGQRITHVDTHQHLHLWPSVGNVVTELATRWHIPAVRITRSAGHSLSGKGVNVLANRLQRRIQRVGQRGPQAFVGFDEGGTLDTGNLVSAISALAQGPGEVVEIGIHPGEHDDADLSRYEWGYRWGDELDAALSPEAREAVSQGSFTLESYEVFSR